VLSLASCWEPGRRWPSYAHAGRHCLVRVLFWPGCCEKLFGSLFFHPSDASPLCPEQPRRTAQAWLARNGSHPRFRGARPRDVVCTRWARFRRWNKATKQPNVTSVEIHPTNHALAYADDISVSASLMLRWVHFGTQMFTHRCFVRKKDMFTHRKKDRTQLQKAA
jgi:hypothetical protein